tara:strand:- start:427 stop:687 length:261 start_codon:yes stop_codon:yes gene_type:complete
MPNDHGSLWLKRIIVVILGLLGILVFVVGLSISSSVFVGDDIGIIVIMGGLLIFFGACRLWPSPTSDNPQHSTEQETPPPIEIKLQ